MKLKGDAEARRLFAYLVCDQSVIKNQLINIEVWAFFGFFGEVVIGFSYLALVYFFLSSGSKSANFSEEMAPICR